MVGFADNSNAALGDIILILVGGFRVYSSALLEVLVLGTGRSTLRSHSESVSTVTEN